MAVNSTRCSRGADSLQIPVGDLRILKDPTRALELHHLKGLKHAHGMLIAYLPKEKIVVQADMAFIGPFQLGAILVVGPELEGGARKPVFLLTFQR